MSHDQNIPSEAFHSVLSIVLAHGLPFFDWKDLGMISACSKDSHQFVDHFEQILWKPIFEAAVDGGKVYELRRELFPYYLLSDWALWDDERGLLSCFHSPDPGVINACGYKQAARSLITKNCQRCGQLTANVVPLTMMRLCPECADNDERSYLITASKAKQAFLLYPKDLHRLPRKVILPVEQFGFFGEVSTFYAITDVRDLAFTKHGSKEGLEKEIHTRKHKSAERFDKMQTTKQIKVRRPKIERMSSSPSDNLKALRFIGVKHGIPVGTVYEPKMPLPRTVTQLSIPHISQNLEEAFPMTMSTKCSLCTISGDAANVFAHETRDHPNYDIVHEQRRAQAQAAGPVAIAMAMAVVFVAVSD